MTLTNPIYNRSLNQSTSISDVLRIESAISEMYDESSNVRDTYICYYKLTTMYAMRNHGIQDLCLALLAAADEILLPVV